MTTETKRPTPETELEKQLEAMREAIKEAYVQLNYALRLSAASVIRLHVNNATDKLQPFIKP